MRLVGILAGVAAYVMIGITWYLIVTITNGANELNENKDKQQVVSAMAGLLDQIGGLVAANAEWDDAVDNTYGIANQDWIQHTWSAIADNVNYDSVFILTSDGETVAGFTKAFKEPLTAATFVGMKLPILIGTLHPEERMHDTVQDFVMTARGPAVVAIAPILPASADKTIQVSPRLLMFAKMLTPDVVANLGNRLAVNDMKLVTVPAGGTSSLPIEGIDGESIGFLSWVAERPGDIAGSVIRLPAILILILLLAGLTSLVWFSSKLAARLQNSEHAAWNIARLDSLTGLPNRLAAMTKLDEIVKNIKDGEVATVLLDLDNFKNVNDSFGHVVGDALLKKVAEVLKISADRSSGILNRLGGDEFLAFFEGPDAVQHAKVFSDAALQNLSGHLEVLGRSIPLGVSIGLSACDGALFESSEIIRRADVAMYQAKKNGKNHCVMYDSKLDENRANKVTMAKDLKFAIENNQITVHYQPIVEARSRRIVGVEALARWQRQDGSLVSADDFIPIAEEFGLIDILGRQVLNVACEDVVSWPNIKLSVNISPLQLRGAGFVDNITSILDAVGLEHERLELEITEGCLIENETQARPIIEALQERGIDVALDDYGTGYSSIAYLRKYNFNRLKIDKSLVRGMILDSSSRAIVQAVAAVAHSMNMQITAEGVEDEEEAKLLYLVGCNSLQGWLYGRPQQASSFANLISGQNSNVPDRTVVQA